ncbi:hypothetical protein F441_16407 [Phytophthora nicotianae CJ01A1]|uniref:DUF155 domain-containing protein n=6 Tax=Phytophthora nicotianae TaxID=4792 RepID=W2PPQ1_PHYN3|nr:hypothetical protein PPTG_15792 [Phytophthora nicotianae INRA-310]ETI37420.1 hypothetical protein F443_16580 [Phytophthora nicotianae P1569]ETK77639.1 hypothetical protein L915_16111 [Phytophthora nicotianae]ETO66193.1 hypothetical protein F444_16555 [Phytophthora nicotianae P1976]ETP07268.1 hypothetical protein F441_16407 [Phytophthora nicotianae CJ01A1]ETP35350.1 hypothetical protein F442_16421 [Phytophthora nicotianae P10297]KUF90245.1 hypothetical protein AM587_10006262 [Phytophthora n
MLLLRRMGARCGSRGGFISSTVTPQASRSSGSCLLSFYNQNTQRKTFTTSLDKLDLPPLPTADEVDATIAAAEAKAQSQQMAKRVQHMPIRAVHIARKMDIASLFQKLYTDRFKVTHYLHKDSIVLRLSGSKNNGHAGLVTGVAPPTVQSSSSNNNGDTVQTLSVGQGGKTVTSRRATDKWVVYFDYGAVVFFNCDQTLVNTLIKHATRFCSDVFEMRGHEEEMLLVGDPAQQKWSTLVENNVLVREIDHINVHVIAGVLSQTVALEFYERQCETILREFEKLNTDVEKKGPRGALFGRENEQTKRLFKIVASNNTLLIDLVSKLRVIDRKRPGDPAWSQTRYHNMWESLLEEFELNERFQNLNFKLELIQHNTKFFLEVLDSHKGERLEWYIIILISVELGIGVYELLMKLA